MPITTLRYEAEDDEQFVEPFSLLESIVKAAPPPRAAAARGVDLEVIHYRDGQLFDVARVPEGAELRTQGGRLLLRADAGRARLRFFSGDEGTIVRARRWIALSSLAKPRYLSVAQDGSYEIALRPGDYGQLCLADGGYLLRYVQRLAEPPPPKRTPLARRRGVLGILGASALVHFCVLATVALALPASMPLADDAVSGTTLTPEFRLVAPAKRPEPPKPQPTPVKTQPEPTPVKIIKPHVRGPAYPAKRVAMVRPAQRSQPQRAPGNENPHAKTAARQMLAALSSLRGKLGSTRVALPTNIAAVRSPSGSAGFRIAGTLNKIKSGISLGDGGRDGGTGKYVRRVLAAGAGGLRTDREVGTRVLGRVVRKPMRLYPDRNCYLSRAAIQRVIAKHMSKIQACYERELLNHHGLAGKLVLDWEIGAAGRVVNARVHSSSISAPVSGCIARVVRRMRFPPPKGGPGTVKVRYPFVFRPSGF
ncbi:MAG: AgmX/PglI C-terminal domain-containing protein [Myxococcales bacterium]|nr:AgmX/PglI C-terminal domain-containing protein [Myxococcales bacterium]